MKENFLSILQCPYCKGAFQFTAFPKPTYGVGEFGILVCSCSKFPVLDDIPIIQKAPVCMYENTTGQMQTEGVSIIELIRLIESGLAMDALLECLVVPPQLPRLLQKYLPWRIKHAKGLARVLKNAEKRRLLAKVMPNRAEMRAVKVLEYFFPITSALGYSQGQYFIKRFCQPRHLAALSLLLQIPTEEKPLLDIACGVGHLEHYFSNRNNQQTTVGIDMNFFHVWIARHWFAPKSFFVCANAGESLPFLNEAFSATVCSDAYHYIPNRKNLLSEINRCAPKRLAILTRVGNAEVMPNEGNESNLLDYIEEIDQKDLCYFGEADLLNSYLKSENPFQATLKLRQQLEEIKWFSFVWNIPKEVYSQSGQGDLKSAELQNRPHLLGKLEINPLYLQWKTPKNEVRFRFEFPDIWYAYENHAMLGYHQRHCTLKMEEWEQLENAQNKDLKKKLIDDFILIGVPQRF